MKSLDQKVGLKVKILLLFFCLYVLGGNSSIIPQNDLYSIPNSSKDGEEVWRKTYEPHNHWSGGLSLWGDEKYIYTCGYQTGQASYIDDLIVLKWDQKGRLIWDFVLDDGNMSSGYQIYGDDNNLYVFGENEGLSLLLKLDKNGQEIWRQYHDENGPRSLCFSNSFIYTFTITTAFFNFEDKLSSLIKWDTSGSLIWNISWLMRWDPSYGYHSSYTDLYVDDDSSYLLGSEENLLTNSSHLLLTKWNSEGNLVWNHSIDLANSVYPTDFTIENSNFYVCGFMEVENLIDTFLCIVDMEGNLEKLYTWQAPENLYDSTPVVQYNSREIIVSGGFDDICYLKRFSKKAEPQSEIFWNSFGFFGGMWMDEKNLYVCNGTSIYSPTPAYLTVIKWDISKNYFLRIGVPLISSGILVTATWLIVKPVYQVKKYKIKKTLEKIERNSTENKNYEGSYRELEELQPTIESFNDPHISKHWNTLHAIAMINRQFQNEFTSLKEMLESGQMELVYTGLVNLLKKSHLPEYDGIIDKEFVSDITDTLKSVSESTEK